MRLPSFATALCAVITIHCSSLPVGQPGEAAENLAQKMLKAADFEKWQLIGAAALTFRGNDEVFWDKKRKLVEVRFKKNLVQFSEVTGKSVCFEGERRLTDECQELTAAAVKRFYNHTFWINPAFHIMSPGAARELVTDNDATGAEKEKLLVKFASGGSTPGDTYLFTVDEEGKIINMRMWVSILMIKGIKAAFDDYRNIEGVRIAHRHKVGGVANVDLSDVHLYRQYPEAGKPDRFQGLLDLGGGMGSDSLNRKR